MRLRLTFIITLFLVLVFSTASPGSAQGSCYYSSLRWSEFRSQFFSIMYPENQSAEAQILIDTYAVILDEEYQRLSNLFATELATPLLVRVYPDEKTFQCLNGMVWQIEQGATHTHVGSREIALIGENIAANLFNWQAEAMNGFRYEMGVLMVNQITGGDAPPGLTMALGVYAQNPMETADEFQSLAQGLDPEELASLSIRDLWENPQAIPAHLRQLSTLSTVAYLVDTYDWSNLLAFLHRLPASRNYERALLNTYQVSLSEIEEGWRQYLPGFLEGRWQINVLHSFDLSPYEILLSAGAYADAVQGIEDALAVLSQSGDGDLLSQAQAMLERARTGERAGSLTRQARQALQNAEFERAIEVALQAQGLYTQLGDDRRQDEINTYIERAQEVIALRNEIDSIDETTRSGQGALSRLNAIGQRLSELSDEAGLEMVSQAMIEHSAGVRQQILIVSGLALMVGLFSVVHQILLRRKGPIPEGRLL